MNRFTKLILWKLSLVYGFAMFIWDIYWRFARRVRLKCKVISVGNIIAGGTGKTPVVRYIAGMAAVSGYKTAVVARGYKRKSKGLIEVGDRSDWSQVGDEPLEIYRTTDNVRVYVHQSKTTAAEKACADGAEVIIVDDGFQHRRLCRDIDLVCLDWQSPFGNGRMLPLGMMREHRRNLKRADIILRTGFDKQARMKDTVNSDKPSFYITSWIENFLNIKTGAVKTIEEMKGSTVLAFCGLANPNKFIAGLSELGIKISKTAAFRDHHDYSAYDMENLIGQAEEINVDCLITTYKDAVKIDSFDFDKFDIYSAMLNVSVVDGDGTDCREGFKEALGL